MIRKTIDPLIDSIIKQASCNESGEPLYPDGSLGRTVEDIYYEWRDTRHGIIDELGASRLGRIILRLLR